MRGRNRSIFILIEFISILGAHVQRKADDLEPLWFTNYDLENVITPVDINSLEWLLINSNYDANETTFLIESFKHWEGLWVLMNHHLSLISFSLLWDLFLRTMDMTQDLFSTFLIPGMDSQSTHKL